MPLPDIAVVLVEPQEAGNIGATARAMSNMGLRNLILVKPVPHLVPEAYRMAMAGKGILEGAVLADTLAAALNGYGFVTGTTRRKGKARYGRVDPRAAAVEVVGRSRRNRCAVVFGREDKGLTNLELELCHLLVTIPASADSESLNLSQAVLLVAYEIFLAAEGEVGGPKRRLAPLWQLEGMYDHAGKVLLEIGYLHRNNPRRMMRVFRKIFARAGLDEREVRAIRGVFRQVEWYCRKAGAAPNRPEGACVDKER